MADVTSHLASLAERITPLDPPQAGSVRFDGEPHDVAELASALYAEWHCRLPSNQRDRDRLGSHRILPRDFARQLAAANAGRGTWQPGWVLREAGEERIVVERAGVRFDTPRDGVRLTASVSAGEQVAVRVPPEQRHIMPGFYVAIGDAGDEMERPACIRVYWNARPAGALTLMHALTVALNRASIPFRLKALSDPREFGRADAVVLYLARASWPVAAQIVAAATAAARQQLVPRTSLLVRELAPGVGVADDPADGQSFGEERTRLLAEATVSASWEAAPAPGRAAAVASAIRAAGYDPRTLHLNPGSTEVAPLPDAEAPRQAATRAQKRDGDEEAWRNAALEIAHHVCTTAITDGERATWVGTTQDEDELGELEFGLETVGPGLYSGTSGIALFLAESWAVTREPRFRSIAEKALQQALHGAQALVPEVRPGFFTGNPGIAWALARAARLFGSDALRDSARSTALAIARGTSPPQSCDVIDGAAGSAPALLALADELEMPELRAAAIRQGDAIMAAARAHDDGSWSWRSEGAEPDLPDLTGFAHGAAGFGSALIQLYTATGDARYLDAANRAFRYERRCFRPAEDNWPDYRQADSANDVVSCAVAWCHGAPGIGLSRLGALRLDPGGPCRAEVEAAIRATSRVVRALGDRDDTDWSLCHGLAGRCEFLIRASRALGDQEAMTAALSAASEAAHQRAGAPGTWVCGVARGSHPSLMIGLAGIGQFLLRLCDPSVSLPLVPGEP